ncbi:MAG TPA: hypothetical protein VI643_01315, partial [Planctomycetota bacterium]|nr:hypothetical protein [Planctomycetota bacterium]
GSDDEALGCLDRAVSIDPESAQAFFVRAQVGLARLQRRRGFPKLAPTPGGFIIEPAAPETAEDAAVKTRITGDFQEALRLYHGQHIRWEQQYALGILALIEGRFSEAREHLAAALELQGSNFRILFHLGLAELFRGAPEKAVARLDEALQIKPRSLEARLYHGLAQLLEWQGTWIDAKMSAAVADLADLLAATDSAEVRTYLAVTHIAYSNYLRWDDKFRWRPENRDRCASLYEAALALLAKAVGQKPGLGIAYLHAGHACSEYARLTREEARFEQATAHFARAMELGPATAYWHVLHGNAWADYADHTSASESRAQRYRRAIDAYTPAVTPEHEYAHIGRGRVQVDLARTGVEPVNNFEAGCADLTHAVELKGRFTTWALSVRADAFVFRASIESDGVGREAWRQRALADLQSILQVDASEANTFRRIGMIHRDRGDREAMRLAFERAIRLDSSLEAELRPLLQE